ncbi:MAG: hypothetical protein Q8934_02510 [Bacillota bacterium]|nr:hypothetical protein [Bacillota bacterium]
MSTFILVIIIGIVATVFSKMKEVNTGKTHSNSVFPYKRDLQEIYKRLKENLKAEEETVFSEPLKEKEFKVEPGEQVVKRVEISPAKPKEEIPILESTNSNQQLDQKKLVDAIIWSEILGEPRSKKPYLSRKTR